MDNGMRITGLDICADPPDDNLITNSIDRCGARI